MGFIKEFTDFAVKGNALDLAVGVIIGAAFGKVVNSIVSDIFMPPLGWAIGGVNFNELQWVIRPAVEAAARTRGQAITTPAPLHGPARPGDLRSNLVDASLAKTILGWQPTVPLADGIALTAEWFASR